MKKKLIFVWILCLTTILFSACSASSFNKASDSYQLASSSAAYEEAASDAYYDGENGWESPEEVYDKSEGTGEASYGGHKVIKNAYMSIRTKNFDDDLAYVKSKATEMGGYVASSEVSGTKPEKYGDSGRNAYLTLRIPQEKLEVFMDDARGLAEVTSESLGTDDITGEYMDTQSRLKIYQTQYDRLLELLDKATKMSDIIELENELTRVTYEIESLTSNLKKWDDLVDYSTLSIELYERNVFLSTTSGKSSVWTRMGEGFIGSLGNVARFFGDLFVWIVSALPILLVLGILVVAIILIVRKNMKKRRNNKSVPLSSANQPEKKD